MPYVTSVERIGIKKGLQKGLEQGQQKGLEQGQQKGLEQGQQKGQAALLLRLLVRKFGAEVDEMVRKRIAAADTRQLEEWGERILTATSLAEVFGEV